MTAENYVRRIVRKIKCSRKKRMEIQKQLLADVLTEVSEGIPLDTVMLQIGEPAAAAREFNENLSLAERKKYKTTAILKIAICASAVLFAAALAVWWILPKSYEVGRTGIFQEEVVEKQCKAILHLIDENDYDALSGCLTQKMKKVFTLELLAEAKNQIGTDWGSFLNYGKFYMQEVKQMGGVFVMVQVNALYENVNVTYTLMFDEKMLLAGFYVK